MLSLAHLKRMYASAGTLRLNSGDTLRWLWSYYATRLPGFKPGEGATVPITVNTPQNRPLEITIQKNGFDWDTVDEIFVQNIYKVKLNQIVRILDLGGNIGLAALYFSQTYPEAEICSVEPIPANLNLLKRNAERNHARIQVVKAAAGASDGTTCFELSDDPRTHSSVGSKGIPNVRTLDVTMLSVPSLMRMMHWDSLDLLKIDIEGGEVEVLGNRPSWLNEVRNVIGEGHTGSGYTLETCRRDLEPMGFQVSQLRQNEGSFLFFAQRAS